MKKLALFLALTPLSVQAALVELWDFNNLAPGAVSGDTISNGVNGETATIRGAGAVVSTSPSTGGFQVDLPGGDQNVNAYIDLPNGIVSSLTSATFETWVTVDSNQNWGRLFDFGTNSNGEQFAAGGAGQGTDYFMFALNRGTDPLTQKLEYVNDGGGGGGVDNGANISLGTQHHIVVTVQDIGAISVNLWYLDGVGQGGVVTSAGFDQLTDNNNWLGRSNWGGDANADASYDQFAIYDTNWSAAEVGAAFAAGPMGIVPEPATGVLAAGSMLGLMLRRRRR